MRVTAPRVSYRLSPASVSRQAAGVVGKTPGLSHTLPLAQASAVIPRRGISNYDVRSSMPQASSYTPGMNESPSAARAARALRRCALSYLTGSLEVAIAHQGFAKSDSLHLL